MVSVNGGGDGGGGGGVDINLVDTVQARVFLLESSNFSMRWIWIRIQTDQVLVEIQPIMYLYGHFDSHSRNFVGGE